MLAELDSEPGTQANSIFITSGASAEPIITATAIRISGFMLDFIMYNIESFYHTDIHL
jgi:hypothetical protein